MLSPKNNPLRSSQRSLYSIYGMINQSGTFAYGNTSKNFLTATRITGTLFDIQVCTKPFLTASNFTTSTSDTPYVFDVTSQPLVTTYSTVFGQFDTIVQQGYLTNNILQFNLQFIGANLSYSGRISSYDSETQIINLTSTGDAANFTVGNIYYQSVNSYPGGVTVNNTFTVTDVNLVDGLITIDPEGTFTAVMDAYLYLDYEFWASFRITQSTVGEPFI